MPIQLFPHLSSLEQNGKPTKDKEIQYIGTMMISLYADSWKPSYGRKTSVGVVRERPCHRIVLKWMPHSYLSLFNQSDYCFLMSLLLTSTMSSYWGTYLILLNLFDLVTQSLILSSCYYLPWKHWDLFSLRQTPLPMHADKDSPIFSLALLYPTAWIYQQHCLFLWKGKKKLTVTLSFLLLSFPIHTNNLRPESSTKQSPWLRDEIDNGTCKAINLTRNV